MFCDLNHEKYIIFVISVSIYVTNFNNKKSSFFH